MLKTAIDTSRLVIASVWRRLCRAEDSSTRGRNGRYGQQGAGTGSREKKDSREQGEESSRGSSEGVPGALDEDGGDELAAELARTHTNRDPEDGLGAGAAAAAPWRRRVAARRLALVEDPRRVVKDCFRAGQLLAEAEAERHEHQAAVLWCGGQQRLAP